MVRENLYLRQTNQPPSKPYTYTVTQEQYSIYGVDSRAAVRLHQYFDCIPGRYSATQPFEPPILHLCHTKIKLLDPSG